MKVKFKTLSAGARGVIRPGDIVEVSESEGQLLIGGGYAEAVETPTEPTEQPKPEPKRGRKK